MMFGDFKILGTPPRGLILQTRRGNNVTNEVAAPPDERHTRRFRELLRAFDRWEVRCDPVGIYNCGGQVWASRRTSIYDESAYRLIIRDDGYRKIPEAEVKTGDVAIYFDEENREIYHVGIVVEMRSLVIGSNKKAPWVLSKLGDSLGEVLHSAYDLRLPNYSLTPEFWTERSRDP